MIAEEVLERTHARLISNGARYEEIARRESPMAKVVHFEIPFDNKERAMKFYAESFDWKLDDMPQMNYVMAQSVAVDERQMPKESGAINGGLFPRPKEAPNPTI